jgi:hypothetical protein
VRNKIDQALRRKLGLSKSEEPVNESPAASAKAAAGRGA